MRNLMLKETHSEHAPWTVVKANDKRRARINVIRTILKELPYRQGQGRHRRD
jgi:polyphosphate kinase 2 (PPK2 family)